MIVLLTIGLYQQFSTKLNILIFAPLKISHVKIAGECASV